MLPQRLFFQLVLCVWLLSYFIIKFGLTSYGKFGLKNYQPATHEMCVKGVKY